jgi:decaprenylphospho-beta-D-ribofuranose 2-oxidase
LLLTYRNQRLTGWGRYPTSCAAVARPERRLEVTEAFFQLRDIASSVIARGGGMAYGDAALNVGGRVVAMSRLNRFLAFDPASGQITCEAGVTLGEILDVCIPEGWFLAVTPGTARATVGGCLACDVHGKNHHLLGSFSQHVLSANVLTGKCEVVTCGPDLQDDLFWATAGGMGLTGIILDVTLQLQRIETAYIIARNIVTLDLEDTFRQIEANGDATYSVAWLDGMGRGSRLGRGVVMLGEHAKLMDLPPGRYPAPLAKSGRRARSLPFGLPSGIIVRPLALAFNEIIYRRYAAMENAPALVDAHRYFFSLDAIDNWNRLYGPRGFLEYQAVLPSTRAFDAIRQMLEMLDRARQVLLFTSVKQLGESSPGHLSFPAPGYAFSFDLSVGDESIMLLLDRCDEITATAGGRVYLAKDARLRADIFAGMYPRRSEWLEIVRRYGAACVFASDMSRRLELTP